MSSNAIRLQELDDTQLEEFIELWVEKKSQAYVHVERIGGAGDKGRDVVAFRTHKKHEDAWDLFQCKRKTRHGTLGVPEAMAELGKVFFHHTDGAYKTLPQQYVFVAPRGITGPLRDLIFNPSTIGPHLLENWDKQCADKIKANTHIPLAPEIRAAIESYDFSKVSYLNAVLIVKDTAAGPALSQVLGLMPDEAPPGVTPEIVQPEELEYLNQLRAVYGEAASTVFTDFEEVLADKNYAEHMHLQRTRFYEAASFIRFHRDKTAAGAVDVFQKDVYHAVIDIHRKKHPSNLERVDAVMVHAGQVSIPLLGRASRPPVRQGMCHHFANDGRLKWVKDE